MISNSNGTVQPSPGYVWDGGSHKHNFAVKVRDDLRLVNGLFYPAPGLVWERDPDKDMLATKVRPDLQIWNGHFCAAAGYEWDGDPNQLATKQRRGLRIDRYLEDGSASYVPEAGWRWVDPEKSDNLDVVVRKGLTLQADGSCRPAPGYSWVAPEDAENFDVNRDGAPLRPRTSLTSNGLRVLNPAYFACDESASSAPAAGASTEAQAVVATASGASRGEMGDTHPGPNTFENGANRSPAMGARPPDVDPFVTGGSGTDGGTRERPKRATRRCRSSDSQRAPSRAQAQARKPITRSTRTATGAETAGVTAGMQGAARITPTAGPATPRSEEGIASLFRFAGVLRRA